MIDWLLLRSQISNKIGKNSPVRLPDVPEIADMKRQLASYPIDSIEWLNLYPGEDYDKSIVDQFALDKNLKICRSWISLIRPGKTAPWHWDWDQNLKEYESKGELTRYSVSLGDDVGHVFICGSDCFHNQQIGSEYKWKNYKEYHGAANFGFTPYYLFHFLGYS
jgi:hypothetical protein